MVNILVNMFFLTHFSFKMASLMMYKPMSCLFQVVVNNEGCSKYALIVLEAQMKMLSVLGGERWGRIMGMKVLRGVGYYGGHALLEVTALT